MVLAGLAPRRRLLVVGVLLLVVVLAAVLTVRACAGRSRWCLRRDRNRRSRFFSISGRLTFSQQRQIGFGLPLRFGCRNQGSIDNYQLLQSAICSARLKTAWSLAGFSVA